MNTENSNEKLKCNIDDNGITNNPEIDMKWDDEKKVYIPNIDDEFIYRYNLNYGFTNNDSSEDKVDPTPVSNPVKQPEWLVCLENDFLNKFNKENSDHSKITKEEYDNLWFKFYLENAKMYEKKKMKVKKRPAKSSVDTFFEIDEKNNKHIYVENLPLDITLEEFVQLVSKYGMIMHEPFTTNPKVKLYKDKDGNIKGDGICCYLKIESVGLAISFLDGSNLRGNIIKVSKAKFESKSDYVPTKHRKYTNKEKRKIIKHQEGLFRWDPETKAIRPKRDCTVILKNAFDILQMKEKPELAFDVKEKINKDARNIGEFKSIQVHELHPEAVVQINFHDPNLSDIAVVYFNNKIWNGRKITAEIWDGRTKYKVKETSEEEKLRLDNWNKALGVEDPEQPESTELALDNVTLGCESEQDKDGFLKSLVEVLGGEKVIGNNDVQVNVVSTASTDDDKCTENDDDGDREESQPTFSEAPVGWQLNNL